MDETGICASGSSRAANRWATSANFHRIIIQSDAREVKSQLQGLTILGVITNFTIRGE